MGLIGHGMAGSDRDKARSELKIPDDYSVEAMIAIGHLGDPETLPEQMRSGEAPTQRKKITEIAREGQFSFENA
jgi:hypothetical protein